MARTRICLDCPAIIPADAYLGRCDKHRAERRRTHRAPTDRGRTYAEQQRRAQVVAAWRAEHGDWCPGWQRDPHPASDLTADHVLAAANGGIDGELQALCKSCNSRKRDRE